MAIDNYGVLVEGDEENGGDIVDFFNEIIDEKNLSLDLNFSFVTYNKQKALIKLTKIPDHYSILTKTDVLVTINDVYFDEIGEDEIRRILFEQEIDKIETDMEKMTFKIAKHNVSTSLGIVNKYTFENVQRAIEVENALDEQIKAKNKKD
jgi:hypothetical protein